MGKLRQIAIAVLLLSVVGAIAVPATSVLADFGLDPGKVFIDNLAPGTQAEYELSVFNLNTDTVVYRVSVREPDYTTDGYEKLPFPDWVTVDTSLIEIPGGSQTKLWVTVAMPEGVDYFGKKAEAWVSIKESESDAMIQVELVSRILIGTQAPASSAGKPEPPTVISSGSVGITASGEVSTPPDSAASGGLSPWVIFGIFAGLVLVGELTYRQIKKRRGAKSATG